MRRNTRPRPAGSSFFMTVTEPWARLSRAQGSQPPFDDYGFGAVDVSCAGAGVVAGVAGVAGF
jgi:hypothetical protein